jgi:hypothetical protein
MGYLQKPITLLIKYRSRKTLESVIILQYILESKQKHQNTSNNIKKNAISTKMALGNSKKYYCHSHETPVHRMGKGSCSSPAIWLLVSSILMDCLQELAGGMEMTNPDDKTKIQQWIDGFVDDTSLF